MKAALELYARIGMGQVHELDYHPAFQVRNYDMEKVDDLLEKVKETIQIIKRRFNK